MTLELLFLHQSGKRMPAGFCEGLDALGCHAHCAAWGKNTFDALKWQAPDVVVISDMMHRADRELCLATLRRHPVCKETTFVLAGSLDGRGDLPDASLLLLLDETDVADYVRFYARLNLHLGVAAPRLLQDPLTSGPLTLEPGEGLVIHGERSVRLRAKEFTLLEFLARRPGRTFSRRQLIGAVWRYEHDMDQRTVDVLVMRLRKSLKPIGASDLVATEHNKGYRFRKPGEGHAAMPALTLPAVSYSQPGPSPWSANQSINTQV